MQMQYNDLFNTANIVAQLWSTFTGMRDTDT